MEPTDEQLADLITCGDKLLSEGWLSEESAAVLESVSRRLPAPILSPRDFRRKLLIDASGLLVPLEDSLDDWQREDYEAADQGWLRMVSGIGDAKLRYYFERPKGHDKTTGEAHMAGWAMHVCTRPLDGVAAASTLDQAQRLRDAIDKMVRRNPWLKQSLRVNNYEVINDRTGSKLKILTSDAGSNQGANPDFVIIDELTVWKRQDLWDALISAAGKKKNCIVVVISNAGYGMGSSWQWRLREECRTDESRWHFRRLDGVVASWIGEEQMADRKTMRPMEARRVWDNQWTIETGDCLTLEDVQAAISPTCIPLATHDGNYDYYVAGLDLSVTKHHSALVVLATSPSTNKVRLVHLKNWNPADSGGKIDLNAVENYVFEILRRFKVECLFADHWNPQLMQNIARRAGAPHSGIRDGFKCFARFPGTALQQEMALGIVNCFKQRRFEMWNEPMLVSDLLKLNIVDDGVTVRIKPPEDDMGHCDRAMALAQCLPVAVQVLDATRGQFERAA